MKKLHTTASLFLIGITVFLITTCYLPTDPGPQPKPIVKTPFDPGFNVLGVLRNDGVPGSSFLRVERAYQQQESNDNFTPIVENAKVRIVRESDSSIADFTLAEDSLRGKIYTDSTFQPVTGEQYILTLTGDSLPAVTGSVLIPPKPEIDSSSVSVSTRAVSFRLKTHPEITLYDVYLFCQDTVLSSRRKSEETGNLDFNFTLSSSVGKPLGLELYGYEKNLTEYITAPITIKPQTYQETITTVSGGYGVFGAVSVCRYIFNTGE